MLLRLEIILVLLMRGPCDKNPELSFTQVNLSPPVAMLPKLFDEKITNEHRMSFVVLTQSINWENRYWQKATVNSQQYN